MIFDRLDNLEGVLFPEAYARVVRGALEGQYQFYRNTPAPLSARALPTRNLRAALRHTLSGRVVCDRTRHYYGQDNRREGQGDFFSANAVEAHCVVEGLQITAMSLLRSSAEGTRMQSLAARKQAEALIVLWQTIDLANRNSSIYPQVVPAYLVPA